MGVPPVGTVKRDVLLVEMIVPVPLVGKGPVVGVKDWKE